MFTQSSGHGLPLRGDNLGTAAPADRRKVAFNQRPALIAHPVEPADGFAGRSEAFTVHKPIVHPSSLTQHSGFLQQTCR